jgi:hypothetical protein
VVQVAFLFKTRSKIAKRHDNDKDDDDGDDDDVESG